MDPNEALREMLRQVEELHHGNLSDMAAADVGRLLADQVKDLDEWLRKGGFLPDAWEMAGRLGRHGNRPHLCVVVPDERVW